MDSSRLSLLHQLTWLQGSLDDLLKSESNLKLCLLIQPNCPGCHQHALPVWNQLYKEKPPNLDMYVVSTAFEDFEFNTMEATQQLLQNQALIGISERTLGPSAAPYYSQLKIPVAFDRVVDKEEASAQERQTVLDALQAQVRRELGSLSHEQLSMCLNQVTDRMLPEKIAVFFHMVRAGGTPSWIIHQSNGQVLDQCLGPIPLERLRMWVEATQHKLKP